MIAISHLNPDGVSIQAFRNEKMQAEPEKTRKIRSREKEKEVGDKKCIPTCFVSYSAVQMYMYRTVQFFERRINRSLNQ
jgi:hypothetical protein